MDPYGIDNYPNIITMLSILSHYPNIITIFQHKSDKSSGLHT